MNKIKDGDLYKIIDVFGRSFEIRYGYYEDYERSRGDPEPIYPDLKKQPEYTYDGYLIVTQMQEICEHGESRFCDGCCVDCSFYRHANDLLGICTCEHNKKKN